LLALCFVMSVTAAAASAQENKIVEHKDVKNIIIVKKPVHPQPVKVVKIVHKSGKHFHPGHWEKHRVGHREFRNNQWTVIYVYKTVYMGPSWY
jgi:hypothetical protein